MACAKMSMGAMETAGPPEDAGMPELGGGIVDGGVEVPDEMVPW
jgi:hypothetical protein